MTAATNGDRLLTYAEAAEIFGVTERTIRRWRKERQIGWVRVGSRGVRIRESEVRRLIDAQTVPAKPAPAWSTYGAYTMAAGGKR